MSRTKQQINDITSTTFQDSFSEEVWASTYKDYNDLTINDTLYRVASATASVEKTEELRKEWTEKFYDLLTNFKATAGGRIYANAGTEWGGTTLMNCFHPDVEVLTSNGPKKICDVEVGDWVLTHKGRYRRVDNTMSRFYTGPVQRFSSNYLSGDIISTPEHPYYQGNDTWTVSSETKTLFLAQHTSNKSPVVMDLVELLADYVNQNMIVFNETSIKTNKHYVGGQGATGVKYGHEVKRFIDVDSKFAYLLGRFVADGCTFKNNQTSLYEVDAFNIAYNSSKETSHVDYMVELFEQVFGITPNIIYSSNNTTYVRKASQIIATVLRRLVGAGFDTKSIPEVIWNSPSSVQQSFLLGVFDGDGFVDEQGEVHIELTNPRLLTEIQTLMTIVGIPCRLRGKRLSAGATFTKEFRQQMSKVYEDDRLNFTVKKDPTTGPKKAAFGFVVEPERTDEWYSGYVFNISVNEDESYVVNNVVVHNCYVGPRVEHDADSLDGILSHLRAQAHTLKSEGGWGENFSYIRPRGAFIHGIGVETPGAVKYMELFDKSSEIITSGSGKKSNNTKAKGKIRKGAMMGVLDCIGGNTPINTTEGKIPVKELVGKTPFLYCTDGLGNVYVRQALLVWSKGVKKTIKVVFDNDDFIECTPDHEFMLSDGTFKKAKDLQNNDSLCVLNKRMLNDYLDLSVSGSRRIIRVEESIEQEVFDISMPDYHNFAANGVFIHNCWHPDIVEFITAKQQPGRLTKFNVSVNCTDDFMERVVRINEIDSILKNTDDTNNTALQQERMELDKWNLIFPDTTHPQYKTDWDGNIKLWKSKGYPVKVYNTISVSWLWNLIMESTYNRAEPGVLFLDRANYFLPLNYAETVFATNPSMPAGTLVHTKQGIFPIETLEGKQFEVKSLDGTWALASCRLSGKNQELLEISFGANKTIRATKEHRWPVYDSKMKCIYKVDTKDLKIGDLIPLNRNEDIGIYGDLTLTYDEGFFVGYFFGDGWISELSDGRYNCGIAFSMQERSMAERVLSIVNRMKKLPSTLIERQNYGAGELYFQFSDKELVDMLLNKYKLTPGNKKIPQSVWESNDQYIKGFVDGLLSADGCVSDDPNNLKITLTTSRKDLAQEFAKLISFAGVPAMIWNTTTKNVSFPNDKEYDKSYDRWDVAIGEQAVLKFINVFDISHPVKQQKLKNIISQVSDKRTYRNLDFVEVVSVKPVESADVWDISVMHNEHVFPTEWCYTGNCGEQTLAPSGVCNLGSLNLTQFVNSDRSGFDLELIKKYTKYLVRFLDNINDLTNAPLPEYAHSIKNKRRIGVGILGWGSALYMLKARFASDRANQLREQVMSTIARTAYEASIDLAVEKGKFSYCDPVKHAEGPFIKLLNLSDEYMEKLRTTGIRNSSLLSIQPTGNTSILANVVSGGLEPVFLHEYIRTVIVNTMPEEIADVCPKWYEGAWHETEMFKFTKEGDEEILRGVAPDGTVYKIDKNRGLTKEVLCEDYGVRFMKKIGEWDPTADWAATALGMSVQDHVNDLKGFARWVDSAMSKTVNVPNDYSFEDFKNIYLDAYISGYVKGVTTYRTGTMTTVLAAKDEKNISDIDEEIVLEDVQLPDSAPATVKTLKAEGKKWYLTVLWWDDNKTRPFGFFVHTNSHEKNTLTNNAVELLTDLARTKNIPEKHINKVLEKIAGDNNVTKVARMISLNLRHGVLIRNIVTTLDKVEDVYAGSFLFSIKKYLSSFIKDGEKIEGKVCQNCGSHNIIYQEGCEKCADCGSSKCG
jgi:ribonucleotide reductase alpha subunit